MAVSPQPPRRRAAPHALPRYLEIERVLRDEIARLKPGDPLPSDAELCERFGVSRMTARQGVQRLADANLVYRVPGQGTFVADQSVHRRSGVLRSFSEDMRTRGLVPRSRVLEAGRRTADVDEQNALRIPAGDPVIVIRRLRLGDDVPMAVERVVLPQYCAAVMNEDLENGSLHDALVRINRPPAVARGHIEPQGALESDAELLEIEVGTPMLVERRTVYDEHELPIEFTETRYSPSRYVFDVELARDSY